ncbi:hypothetical protein ACRYGU_16740 [Mycobacteroides abscessus]
MKLEPTAARLEAVSDYIDRFRASAEYKSPLVIAQEIFAALNSVPEGAPVGTIARRPDGFWIAHMAESGWEYSELVTGTWRGSDADSWPVIFTPGEAVGSGPTTDGGETYDPREPSREELRAYFHKDLAEHCQADDPDVYPDEYHEGDKPRLERLMREPSVFDGDEDAVEELAKWLATEIGTCTEGDWELRSKPNYYHDRARELLDFGYRKVSDPTAQQEPKLCSGCYECQAPKRHHAPRVVDRLGVDEQGAEWKRRGISRDSYIWEYRFRNGVWQVRLVGNEVWASMSPGTEPTNGPFTEVLEPRVLPSLDCEEARDGTVWSLIVTASGTKRLFQYRDSSWHTRLENALWKQYDGAPSFCTTGEKFTEVLGDPS